jgi:hypothetical protein
VSSGCAAIPPPARARPIRRARWTTSPPFCPRPTTSRYAVR